MKGWTPRSRRSFSPAPISPKTVFGASGFLGRHLAQELGARGMAPWCPTRADLAAAEAAFQQAKRAEALENAVKFGCDGGHLLAQSGQVVQRGNLNTFGNKLFATRKILILGIGQGKVRGAPASLADR